MKRFVSLAAAAVLMGTAAACGNNTSSSPEGSSVPEISTAAELRTETLTEDTAASETTAETSAANVSTASTAAETTGETEYSMHINDKRTFSFKADNAVWTNTPHKAVHGETEINYFRAESGFPVLYVEVKNLGEGGYEEFAETKRSKFTPVECSKAEYPAGETGVVKSHGGEGTVFTEYFIPAEGRYIVFGFTSYEADYDRDEPEFEKILESVTLS